MKSYNGFTPQQRERGGRLINKAISEGILPPQNTQPCVMCGQDQGIRHYHCEDYSEENILSDARVLCWRCHMMIHSRFAHPQSFAKYMIDVNVYKKQYPPVYRNGEWDQLQINFVD